MFSKKKIICITGADGTGKSTLINSLREKNSSIVVSEIWDALEGNKLFKSKRDVDNYLCTLTPESRLLFLAHARKYSIDKVLGSDAPVVILNSYYYKYFATEAALGATSNLVEILIAAFPKPDVVLRLVLPISESVKRKTVFSRYECGLADIPSSVNFCTFQAKALMMWNVFDQSDWHEIDSGDSKEKILTQALQLTGI